MGLNVALEGDGKVVEQSLNEGDELVKGSTIVIKLI
jgi:cell division protein FtsI (penicillin-binding protein 3)